MSLAGQSGSNGRVGGLLLPLTKIYRSSGIITGRTHPGTATGSCKTRGRSKISDRDRTRTCNPRLRKPMPYPLGHTATDRSSYVHRAADLTSCNPNCTLAYIQIMKSYYNSYKIIDRDRTRTCNPQIRSLVPYPLGHTTRHMKSEEFSATITHNFNRDCKTILLCISLYTRRRITLN